jgi:hypothetical protein
MATNAIVADGTVVTFNAVTIGEVMSLSGSRSRNVHEVLSTDSTDGAIERLCGALNEGPVTMRIIYDGSAAGVYNTLNTAFTADPATSATLLITYKDTSNISATAFISELGTPSFNEGDGTVEVDVTFAVSGKATYTDVP